MSRRASRESLALLSVVAGSILIIEGSELTDEFMPTILYAKKVAQECLNKFPEYGDERKNEKWVMDHISKIDDDIHNAAYTYSFPVLLSITHYILTDLLLKINDDKKLSLIEPLGEAINTLIETYDPEGINFAAYEEADRIVKKLYGYIGFTQ